MSMENSSQHEKGTGEKRERGFGAAPAIGGLEPPPPQSPEVELQSLRAENQRLERILQEALAKVEQSEIEQRRERQEIEERMRIKREKLALANQKLQQEMKDCQEAEERVHEQNEFLNHVLESLTHPFYVLDAKDYTIKMANSAAIKGELPPGITCYALTHRRDRPCADAEHGCPLQLIKATKKPVTLEHIHFDREGNRRYVEVHGYPIFDREGNVAQMLEYSLDITARKKMEQELRDNAERIKHFAYAVSHDLKSPMVGVLGLTRILHKRYGSRFDAKGTKICDQILKGVEQMADLVEEINAFIKAKETRFYFELMDPLEILHVVREEFDPLLTLRGISWTEPDGMPSMFLDRMSMLRVFRNLVDNALKYGGDSLNKIVIAYREEDNYHLISVSDDGAGFNDADGEKIFEVFGRQEDTRGIEGTGLGLAIIREIVEKHQGWIWGESGKLFPGARFYIALPKDLGMNEVGGNEPAPSP